MIERLQDAARMAARATVPITITVTEDGFKVAPARGRTWASRFVAFSEVDLANSNVLAAAVQRVARDLSDRR